MKQRSRKDSNGRSPIQSLIRCIRPPVLKRISINYNLITLIMFITISFEGKIYSCDCRRLIKDDKKEKEGTGSVIFATTDQSGQIVVSQVDLSMNKKNKVSAKFKEVEKIHLASAWSMAVELSPSTKYIGNGGLDNLCSIYEKNDQGKYTFFGQLQGHNGYLSCIRWIEHGIDKENLVLTCSGDSSVRLWDIETIVFELYSSYY